MIFTINLPIRKFNLPLGNQLPRFPLSRYLVIKIHLYCAVYKFRSTPARCTTIPRLILFGDVPSIVRSSRDIDIREDDKREISSFQPVLHNGVLLHGCETNASCRVDSIAREFDYRHAYNAAFHTQLRG